MILPHCVALLGLLSGSSLLAATTATATATASNNVSHTGTDQPADLVPSWLPKSKSNLRKTPTTKDLLEKAGEGIELPQLDKITALEQLELIQTFRHAMLSLANDLGNFDLSGATEDLKEAAVTGKEYTYKAVDVVEEALTFLNKTLRLGNPPAPAPAVSQSFPNEDEHLSADDAEVSRRLNVNAQSGSDESNGKWHDKDKEYEYKEFRSKHKEYQKKGNAKFDQFHHFGASFQHHATKHHTEKRDNMRDAILSGDFDAAFAAFASTGSGRHGQHTSSREHRRMKATHGRRLSKREQCELLADCAGAMTMFDMFVYYYSDDIDPSKGEVDDNLLKFDETDIVGKYIKVQQDVKAVRANRFQETSCNNLLQLFHRTIEHGNLPEWEGASVNQVCLAEGSTVFVKYQEMVKALVGQQFPSGYTSVSEQKWMSDTDKSVNLVAEKLAVEPFQCAEKLFYHGGRKDKEEFPFGGCGGENSNHCGISKYHFPVKFDVGTVVTKAKNYETRTFRSKCDRGYEIKNIQQCEEAGIAVGGKLDGNGKVVSHNWGHTPCGCFMSGSTIHWDTGSGACKNDGWKYSVICEEHRNRNTFEKVAFKTKCDSGYEILSAADCEDAGQALGGYLEGHQISTHNWGHTPCGCFLGRDGFKGKVHFDTGGKASNCANQSNKYLSVCKRKKTSYKTLPKRIKCDSGSEIKSQNECATAGRAVGGKGFKVGNWGHTPNYCFIDWPSGEIHYDTSPSTARNDGWRYDVVCKSNENREKYRKVQFATKCPTGYGVKTAQECEEAGQAVGGFLDRFRVEVNNWGHTPCGCFVNKDDKIHFDTGTTGCANEGFAYEAVCLQDQLSVNKVAGRDVHGKLLSNDQSGFVTYSYDHVKRTADSCIAKELDGMEKACMEESGNRHDSKYYECRVDKREKAIEACDRFGPIQTALELVFGSNTSPGFICGIADAIVTDGVPMPGMCCLDAPYELDGDAWGHPYDCETNTKCKNPGPYLAGVSPDACNAHGGTWCPAKADCGALKTCVESMAKSAKAEERLAFVRYLEAAPEIKNANDHNHCGRAREYFGFDELFINDQQICEDIEQLKYSRDFDFMNEFFKQGSSAGGDSDDGAPKLSLVPPDRTRSDKEEVKQHWSWMATNFALVVSAEGIAVIKENVVEMDCMCDPFCVSENICKGVKTGINSYLSTIVYVLEKIVMVAQHLFDSLSPQASPEVRSEENTEVLHGNMQLMADYLVDMRNEIKNRRELHALALPGGEEPTSERDGGAKQCNAAFEVKLKVLKKTATGTKSVFALSTLGGDLVPAEFTFSKLGDEDKEVSVDYNKTSLELGKTIIRFGADVGADFLIMKAHPVNGTEVAHLLLELE